MMVYQEKSRKIIFQGEGIVQEGRKEGRALGFPTANIPCAVSLPSGIYAGEVVWNSDTYPAALYKENGKVIIEAHLLDFSKDLYGETLTFRAYHKIREVKTFATKEALITAIEQDIKTTRALCSQE